MDCQHEHRPARAQSTWQHAGVIERPRVRPSAPRLALQGWALWLTQPRTFGTHHAHDPTIQRATQSYTGTRSLYITDHAFIMLDPLAGCAAAAHLGLQGAKLCLCSVAAWVFSGEALTPSWNGGKNQSGFTLKSSDYRYDGP